MTVSAYGSRPDLLPRSLTEDAAAAQGLRALTWAQNRVVEAASLDRFRQLPGDVLDWDGVPVVDSIVYEDELDAVRSLSQLISNRTHTDSHLFVLWGTLILPTVRMPARMLDQFLADIVAVGPQFWLYLPSERYLVECLPDGQITGAFVPDDDGFDGGVPKKGVVDRTNR